MLQTLSKQNFRVFVSVHGRIVFFEDINIKAGNGRAMHVIDQI